MGFSPLTGVTMGTRSGDFDPSALRQLMHKTGMSIDDAVDMLNHESGLLGISGISSDMRDLIESKEKRAKLARRIFINRIVRYVGAYAAEMDGVDGIVFTAGVGEHDSGVRAGVMSYLKYLGLRPDYKANRTNGEVYFNAGFKGKGFGCANKRRVDDCSRSHPFDTLTKNIARQ